MTREQRRKAIIRRRIFVSVCLIILIAVIALVAFVISAIAGGKDKPSKDNTFSNVSSAVSDVSSEVSSAVSSVESEPTPAGALNLDKQFSKLLLVNDKNPLPDDYDYEGNLTTIPQKYIKGSLTQIDKDVWPYLQAMLDAALSEGIDIGVWSPYRSYNTQKWLFDNQVQRCIEKGLDPVAAETEAATVVARPGTSEHHTGLALDINCANDSFETTEAYKWLQKNAAHYGFIMRYSAEKQSITGVIHESWHYRFVGINHAKEIKRLNMCLEEYVEHIK